MNEFQYAEEEGELVVGNTAGLRLFGRIRELTKSIESEKKARKEEIAKERKEREKLVKVVDILKRDSESFRRIRNRFHGVFCRDISGKPTVGDYDAIYEGNEVAYGGDVLYDVTLYRGLGCRQDLETFRELYGFDPAQVFKFGMLPGSINI